MSSIKFLSAIFSFLFLFSCAFVPGTQTSAPVEIKALFELKSDGLSISPNAQVDYGTITTDTTKSITFSIVNPGWEDLELTGTSTVDIADTTFFSLVLSPSSVVQKQKTTSFTIQFHPGSATDLKTTSVTILNSSPDIPSFTFSLKGIASAIPKADIHVRQASTPLASGGSFSMGEVVKGTQGPEMTFTIENLGTATLNLNLPVTSSDAQFALTTAPGSASLAPGAYTTFKMRFNPAAAGAQSSTLTITSDDDDESNYTITLNGTGTVPLITLEKAGTPIAHNTLGHDFGYLNVSAAALTATFTIKNTGDAPLNLSGTPLAVVTGDTASFSVTTQPGATIAAGASTTFVVRFDPGSPVAQTAQITLTSNANNYPIFSFHVQGIGTKILSFPSNYNYEDNYIKADNLAGLNATLGIYKTTYGLGMGRGGDGMFNKSVLSFYTESLPDSLTVIRAYFTARYSTYSSYSFMATPWEDPSIPNNLLIDLKSPYFGSGAAVAAEDFADSTDVVSNVAQLDYFNTGTKQSSDFSPAGLLEINPLGRTQLRLGYALEQDNTNYLFIDYGSYAVLTVEYHE